MFNPLASRTVGDWRAIVSSVGNGRANCAYALGEAPDRIDQLFSFFLVHGRPIRCKLPDWASDRVRSDLASWRLRPRYGAHTLVSDALGERDDQVVDGDRLTERFLSGNPRLDRAALSSYGAPGSELVTAQLGGEAVGLVVVTGRWAGVAAMYTHPDARRQGLAVRLLSHLIAAGRARGAQRTYLQVVESNRSAWELYTRFGFDAVGSYEYWE